MHPFRILPDPIDSVACGHCGHPVWDHCVGDTCAECDNRDPASACQKFWLYGFTEATTSTFEDFARASSI
jgi:hypothetical protein